MKTPVIAAIALFPLLNSCGESAPYAEDAAQVIAERSFPAPEPEEEVEALEIITFEGMAYNRKGGAVVQTDSLEYWIQDQHFWSEDTVNKRVHVKGEYEKRDDNPVFVDTADVAVQGIPVETPEQAEAMKWRHWIRNAEITLLDQ